MVVLVGTLGCGIPVLAAPEVTLDEQYERLWSEENYAAAEPVARQRVDGSLGTADPATVSCRESLQAVRAWNADRARERTRYSPVGEPDIETLRHRRHDPGIT